MLVVIWWLTSATSNWCSFGLLSGSDSKFRRIEELSELQNVAVRYPRLNLPTRNVWLCMSTCIVTTV